MFASNTKRILQTKYSLQFASIRFKIFASILLCSDIHHRHGQVAWRWTCSMYYTCIYSYSSLIIRFICFRSYLFRFCSLHIIFVMLLFASICLISYSFRFYLLLFASYHIRFASIRFLSYSIRIPNFLIRFEADICESNPSIHYFA
jgi:hypothetical protein